LAQEIAQSLSFRDRLARIKAKLQRVLVAARGAGSSPTFWTLSQPNLAAATWTIAKITISTAKTEAISNPLSP
jgi:hypothetical protein